MKNSLKLTLTLAGLALLSAPVLRATEPTTPPVEKSDRRERREDRRENAKKMAEELNLTADQQTKVEAIHQQTGEALKAIHNDASLNEEQKREKAKALRTSTQDQVHALLTPEQKIKAKELRAKHGERGEKRHGEKPHGEKPAGN